MASRPDASSLVHGAAWRAASLASRVAFLALIVPRTIPGDYGLFFSYSSLGLLLSRVVSYGAIDHLPTVIKGSRADMVGAVGDFAPLSLLAALVTLAAIASDSLIVASAALALSMAAGLMLAGAVRSVGPAWFERWLNLHPLLFLGLALVFGNYVSAKQLLIYQSFAILVSQLLLVLAATAGEVENRPPYSSGWPRRVIKLLAGGQSRMMSDAMIAACIRAVAIAPVLFGMGAISDSLALALALGEAAWTVGMILVHRNFAYYCSVNPDVKHSVWSAFILLVGITVGGVLVATVVHLLDWISVMKRFEADGLIAAFAFFAGIAALSELRYFDVASGYRLAPWLAAQVAFVLLAGFSAKWFGEAWSLWLLASLVVAASLALISYRWRTYSIKRRSA